MQLTKLAEQKEAGEVAAEGATRQHAAVPSSEPAEPAGDGMAASDGGPGNAAGGSGDMAALAAAVLPFDIVATAYRRKKLMEALAEDNKWGWGWG